MDSCLTCSAEHNLSGKASARVSVDRKAHARYGLENGALARGLVADHDDLGQIDKLGNPERPETVDSIEKGACIGAVELGDNLGREHRGIHLVPGGSCRACFQMDRLLRLCFSKGSQSAKSGCLGMRDRERGLAANLSLGVFRSAPQFLGLRGPEVEDAECGEMRKSRNRILQW